MNDQTLAALIALVGTVTVVILTTRQQGTRDLVAELNKRVGEQGVRITVLEHRDRLLVDYAWQLRQHIVDEKDPPPPAWPEGLDR